MKKLATKKVAHVCPRNCFSSCTFVSTVENDRLAYLSGDHHHPYTNGKLCAKGYSYIEGNNHRNRLKFPYYQEVKGSGKFRKISWEQAFDLIVREMVKIHQQFDNFLPLALYKGSGNLGVHHYVTEEFYFSIGEITRLIGSARPSTGFNAIQYDMGKVKMADPTTIKNAAMIIIWGANPAATNIHLIPLIIEAKVKGAKVIVVDPLDTQTAKLADLYIQIRPSSDGALANLLVKKLISANAFDKEFLEKYSFGFKEYFAHLSHINDQEYLAACDVPEEAVDLLVSLLKDSGAVAHIIGNGILKHHNGGQNVRAIEALAAVHGDIGKMNSGIFHGLDNSLIFNNQRLEGKNRKFSLNHLHDLITEQTLTPPIKMLWISCANPLVQEPNPQFLKDFMSNIPFVVTVDHFLTPTAKMSNLILPTTTHFEEMDIVCGMWYEKIALNEQAVKPFHESRSEWAIMKELAMRLKETSPEICSFPVHSSEKEYLNAQFNDTVLKRYYLKSVADFKNNLPLSRLANVVWEEREFATKTGKYQFYSPEAKEYGLPPMPLFVEGESPTLKHPFWLLTPHQPYALNSQFHYLQLVDEKEAYVGIHPQVAKERGIFDGEIIRLYNEQASVEIKAVYSSKVPKDILMIYQGWYPDSQMNVNDLVTSVETDMGENVSGVKGTAFYDTFVNVGKL